MSVKPTAENQGFNESSETICHNIDFKQQYLISGNNQKDKIDFKRDKLHPKPLV